MPDNADIIGRLNSIDEQLNEIRAASLLSQKEIYNTAEACAFLGVKKSYLYQLVREHKIPYSKSKGGKFTYFNRNDLVKWMTYHQYSTDEM
jgi:excisionase family DNA binding protein